MPFIYKPSLWGYVASAIFIVLTIIAVQDSEWLDAFMWALLGFSFTVKYMPKFLIFSIPGTMAAFVTLAVGGALFIVYASDRLGQN